MTDEWGISERLAQLKREQEEKYEKTAGWLQRALENGWVIRETGVGGERDWSLKAPRLLFTTVEQLTEHLMNRHRGFNTTLAIVKPDDPPPVRVDPPYVRELKPKLMENALLLARDNPTYPVVVDEGTVWLRDPKTSYDYGVWAAVVTGQIVRVLEGTTTYVSRPTPEPTCGLQKPGAVCEGRVYKTFIGFADGETKRHPQYAMLCALHIEAGDLEVHEGEKRRWMVERKGVKGL